MYTHITMESMAGFQELDHTADWSIRVWGSTLPELFSWALKGMYALSGILVGKPHAEYLSIHLEGVDEEDLLVNFLDEALYIGSGYQRAVTDVVFETLDASNLIAKVSTADLVSVEKEIKAVTFHNLSITKTEAGFQTIIVFDV